MIKLVQMRDYEFARYVEAIISSYAKDIARSRMTSEKKEHLDYARKQINTILPKGNRTDNHYFYSIYDENQKIGAVWFSIQEGSLIFLHDIFLDKLHRRKGYGSETIKQVESMAIKKGVRSIALHVFYHNKAAQKFYKKNGYLITGLQMFKQLSDPQPKI